MVEEIGFGPPSVEAVWIILPWWKRILVKWGWAISIGKYSEPGWSKKLYFFIFQCRNKKIHVDYRHGYDEYLSCDCHKAPEAVP